MAPPAVTPPDEDAARGAPPAFFPRRLRLPQGDPATVEDAAAGVAAEVRDAGRWARLVARSVAPLAGEEGLYVVEVEGAPRFEWTWEGSVAFRLRDGEEGAPLDEPEAGPAGVGAPVAWWGSVVEVDEAGARLFLAVEDPGAPPEPGPFHVRPFPFLARLHAVYTAEAYAALRVLLPPRLRASLGGVHPRVSEGLPVDLTPDDPLARGWGRTWSVLWGPPGTGKTRAIGERVARCLEAPDERVLVVSTTNQATDGAALRIGEAARRLAPAAALRGRALRVGSGGRWAAFAAAGLEEVLEGGETETRRRLSELEDALHLARDAATRARLRRERDRARGQLERGSLRAFRDAGLPVVVTTAYNALATLTQPALLDVLAQGGAPFTTVVVDEAGLIPRAAAAVLSLLAARRVVLVGDPRQLAPVARVARVLPTRQAVWLGASALHHLDGAAAGEAGVHLLDVQHRMAPEVRAVVSGYQYEGRLRDGPGVGARPAPAGWEGARAVWYVLDEHTRDPLDARARRGPGGRSWVRPVGREVLERLFAAHPELRASDGLYVTPFVAQARVAAGWLLELEATGWRASTVHSQQGAEADVVVFDTVHASSTAWPLDDWQRLVNVGLSRARQAVVLVASRDEMRAPYLRPLLGDLAPRVLRRRAWHEVAGRLGSPGEAVAPSGRLAPPWTPRGGGGAAPAAPPPWAPPVLGVQLARRRALRQLLSREQERLCRLPLDGKPRLVRGVAGSGKTAVLAHWAARLAGADPGAAVGGRLWVVYANASLRDLLAGAIEEAWAERAPGRRLPWERLELLHVGGLLRLLLPEAGLDPGAFGFDYDRAAAAYLSRRPALEPRCAALFVDEAQDMGPETLRLLAGLVRPAAGVDPKERAILLFYDNAQNLYGRPTPRWSDLGLDLRGRSTVMTESFRATRPIAELALNVLVRLEPAVADDPDHRELVRRELVGLRPERDGAPWWRVAYNRVAGPLPELRRCASRRVELEALARRIAGWVHREGVRPGDVRVVYNGIRADLEAELGPRLRRAGIGFRVQTSQAFTRDPGTVVATTAHSLKGHDAEVVCVAGVDRFVARGEPLARVLYVALTRARSVLYVSGVRQDEATPGGRIGAVLEGCLARLTDELGEGDEP